MSTGVADALGKGWTQCNVFMHGFESVNCGLAMTVQCQDMLQLTAKTTDTC